MIKILFIGESWQGSSGRSLREALALQPEVEIADIAEDHFIPGYHHLPLRIANRLLRPLQVRELKSAIMSSLGGFHPDAVVVYKGAGIVSSFVEDIQRSGTPVINVFPDYSPHAYGKSLHKAIGCYDLVISTKPFHPKIWDSMYGYSNPCVCVPHGYDPSIHCWSTPPFPAVYDLALCGTWRPEYHRLMEDLAQLLGSDQISVAIAGPGWEGKRSVFPPHWKFVGSRTGRAYGEFLRLAKIVIAPVNREVVISGMRQPGDEDTTRTYELAAAHCFFLHQRTDFLPTIYDENNEVPLWNDATDLAYLVRRWLPDDEGRHLMAARAHHRAVPAYSIPERASSVLLEIKKVIHEHKMRRSEI